MGRTAAMGTGATAMGTAAQAVAAVAAEAVVAVAAAAAAEAVVAVAAAARRAAAARQCLQEWLEQWLARCLQEQRCLRASVRASTCRTPWRASTWPSMAGCCTVRWSG